MHAGNHFLRTLLAISLCAIAQAAEPVASAPDAVAQPTAAAAPVANAPQAPSKSLKVPSEYRRKVVKGKSCTAPLPPSSAAAFQNSCV